jgi:alkyldihydroxyacetonephosphate synthase
MARVRNRWGWGFEDATVSAEEAHAAAPGVSEGLGFDLPGDVEDPVPLEAVRLPAPRLEIPAGLRAWCTTDTAERAAHAYGKSYLDAVRALRGDGDGGVATLAGGEEARVSRRLMPALKRRLGLGER